ncbi:hypothetical protein F4781DRAFT_438393 [Annulohypoxylon bovei var. microspora]|nr:hypothetical protein F4781DRAFT_438393 [Annulohypoxylon bovei var. microspora]
MIGPTISRSEGGSSGDGEPPQDNRLKRSLRWELDEGSQPKKARTRKPKEADEKKVFSETCLMGFVFRQVLLGSEEYLDCREISQSALYTHHQPAPPHQNVQQSQLKQDDQPWQQDYYLAEPAIPQESHDNSAEPVAQTDLNNNAEFYGVFDNNHQHQSTQQSQLPQEAQLLPQDNPFMELDVLQEVHDYSIDPVTGANFHDNAESYAVIDNNHQPQIYQTNGFLQLDNAPMDLGVPQDAPNYSQDHFFNFDNNVHDQFEGNYFQLNGNYPQLEPYNPFDLDVGMAYPLEPLLSPMEDIDQLAALQQQDYLHDIHSLLDDFFEINQQADATYPAPDNDAPAQLPTPQQEVSYPTDPHLLQPNHNHAPAMPTQVQPTTAQAQLPMQDQSSGLVGLSDFSQQQMTLELSLMLEHIPNDELDGITEVHGPTSPENT